MTKTLGEYRIRTEFNVAEGETADSITNIKNRSAELIDICQHIKSTNGQSEDPKHNQEVNRLADIAQEKYEEAAMWAVKAATA